MAHNERCKLCKSKIFGLLNSAFGKVDKSYNLNLPSRLEDYKGKRVYDDLAKIYESLQNHRGFKDFVNLPNVDFFVHTPQMIVEFDESQHFTKPRAISLSLYPAYLKLGFEKDKWIKRCLELDKRDNDPPYRDEQRAWYDALRDFADFPTVRLLPEEAIWCDLDPVKKSDVEWMKNLIGRKMEGIHEAKK
jgi:hypothetical protein